MTQTLPQKRILHESFEKVLVLSILSFFINPLITIVGLFIYALSFGNQVPILKRHKRFLVLFGIMCCVFVSLINMEKVPEIDLETYVDKYKIAGNYNLLTYLLVGPHDVTDTYKEPLYYVLVWCLNRIFNGNVLLFKFSISMIEYSLLVASVLYFGIKNKIRIIVIMTGVVWMCFYPWIFTHTMNIVRQTLANCILCYIAIRHFFYGKREWIPAIAMVFVHSTSALFVPLILLPWFKKPFYEAKIWYAAAIASLFAVQIAAAYLLNTGNFGEGSSMGYALNRSQYEVGDYDGLSMMGLFFLVVMLGYSLYLFLSKTILKRFKNLSGLSFMIIFLASFILINFENHQFTGRYSHYFFMFVPYLLMVLFSQVKINKTVLLTLSVSIIIMFTVYLHLGFWKFNITFGGWFTPVVGYLLEI